VSSCNCHDHSLWHPFVLGKKKKAEKMDNHAMMP
jgi:hypothetical protein